MNKLLLISMIVFISIVSGCSTRNIQIGTLEGKISIGPLCPVERIPPDPNCQPTLETYRSYPVNVWTFDKKHKIELITPELDGRYSLNLTDGKYIIDLDNPSRIGSSNLPAAISIISGNTTVLNINIDTGIR